MRRRLALLLLLLAALSAPAAAAPSKRPPRGVYLRSDPAPPSSAPPPAAPTPPVPAGRLELTGLPSVLDGPAQCRATCARRRYACEGGGEDCAPSWAACLRPCSAGIGR